MSKDKMLIPLASLTKHSSKPSHISSELNKLLEKSHYFVPSFTELAHQCLLCFNFRRTFKNEEAIQNGCRYVISKIFTIKLTKDEAVLYFIKLFLNIDKLPLSQKIPLEQTVKKDLAELNALLEYYYSIDLIKQFRKEPVKPMNHQERMILDFYLRAVEKKELIISHLINKLDDIAIEKSKVKSNFFRSDESSPGSLLLKEFEYHSDFPYTDYMVGATKNIYKIDYERLDYRQINPWRNKENYFRRTTDISKGITPETEKEFLKNFRWKTAIQILNKVYNRVASLPILKSRTEIFLQLIDLYKMKKWYGFYALGLPQIEGIFAEMTGILETNKQTTGSLTDKVQQVRPHYELSAYFFDYYAYYLPDQRNKFSHLGQVGNIYVKSALLVLDLQNIIAIFEGLNTPLIELNNLIEEGVGSFTEITKFTEFFSLIKKISRKHLPEIQDALDNLSYNVLAKKLDMVKFIEHLDTDFQKASSEFEEKFNIVVSVLDKKKLKILTMTPKDIQENFAVLQAGFENDMKMIFEKDLSLLLDTRAFIANYIKLFPKQSPELIQAIHHFKTRHAKALATLNVIHNRFSITIAEYIPLFAGDWKHTSILRK